MNRIKKGDTVEVIAGDDLGARGEVLRLMPKENRVVWLRASISPSSTRTRSALVVHRYKAVACSLRRR